MCFRTALVATVFILAGCSAAPTEDSAATLFDSLTSHEWTASSPGAFGYHESLKLRRDGTYHWQRMSDYLERDDRGSWNVTLENDSSGHLRLSASAEIRFRVEKNELRLERRTFSRGERISYADTELKKTFADLKPIEPSENFKRLTSTEWVKTDPFEDYRLPQRITFHDDGRYVATYRDGSCRHGGTWALLQESHRTVIEQTPDANECDLRGVVTGFSGGRLTFADEFVLLGAPYAPIAKRPKTSVFLFDRYDGTVMTRGEFSGSLVAGRAVRIQLSHETETSREFRLLSIDIGFQKVRLAHKSFQTEGEPQWVFHKDLREEKVTAENAIRYAVNLTPPFAGEAAFLVRLKYEDDRQPYDGYEQYIATVLTE